MLVAPSKVIFLICIFLFLSGIARAREPSRPVTFYIMPAVGSELEVFTTQQLVPAVKRIEVKSKLGILCTGVVGSKFNNWVLKKTSCSFTDQMIEEVVLIEYPKNGNIKHGIAQIKFDNGAALGILLHIGDETSLNSTRTVDSNDIKKFYGDFPNWIFP